MTNKRHIIPCMIIFNEDDDEYSKPQIRLMEENIKKAYANIKMEYDQRVECEVEEYMKALETGKKNIFLENLLRKGYVPESMKFNDPKQTGNVTKLSEITPDFDEIGTKIPSEMPSKVVECGTIALPMYYYAKIERSIYTKDRLRATHIPLFDDEQKDRNLIKELKDVYPEGIHGTAENWNSSDMNDWLLYRVMRKMLEEPEDLESDPDLFYYCIYRLWPNKWTQSQLSQGFPSLCAVFAEDGYDVKGAEPWKSEPEPNPENPVVCYACPFAQCSADKFYKVTVYLPNDQDDEHCSSNCWKKTDLDEAADLVHASDQEKQQHKVVVYINKDRLTADTSAEGAWLGDYVANLHLPLCEFFKEISLPFQTCREAYKYVLKTVERPMVTLVQCSDPISQWDLQTRTRNFRKHLNKIKRDAKIHRDQQYPEYLIGFKTKISGCRHYGPCGTKNEDCVCGQNQVCTNACKCSVNCIMRFPGCACEKGRCKTKQCLCVSVNWECHPSTCKTCRCEISDRGDGACSNCNITHNRKKEVSVAESRISGHGLFLDKKVKKGEFILEYVGERISDQEAERRGVSNTWRGVHYLFDLHSGGAIDSGRAGNESRFANHSDNPTCIAKSKIVGGIECIAYYAAKDLEKGTELTLDYGHLDEETAEQAKPAQGEQTDS